MSLLKELKQLNESAVPSKFYLVASDGSAEYRNLAEAIFQLFGYKLIGTAEELLTEEQQEDFQGTTNLPHFDELDVYAKIGLSADAFKDDEDLVKELYNDIDGHHFIDVN